MGAGMGATAWQPQGGAGAPGAAGSMAGGSMQQQRMQQQQSKSADPFAGLAGLG
jgi:hypothetical protein